MVEKGWGKQKQLNQALFEETDVEKEKLETSNYFLKPKIPLTVPFPHDATNFSPLEFQSTSKMPPQEPVNVTTTFPL
jgi:hypothetical protein